MRTPVPTSLPAPSPTTTLFVPTAVQSPIASPPVRVTPTAVPKSAVAPTSTPLPASQDICYRAIPVQDALLDVFPGPDLCGAITVGELYRLQDLEVYASRTADVLQRGDFAGMPNLLSLGVETDLYGLAPDVFHELSALSVLYLEFELLAGESLPAGLLSGLPSGLTTLILAIDTSTDDDEGARLMQLPPDLFASAPRLEQLDIRLESDRGHCLAFDRRTLAGLTKLEFMSVKGGHGLWPVPPGLFADVDSLEVFELDGRPCKRADDGVGFERDYSEHGLHRLYFPSLPTLLRMADYCGDSGYCEAAGLIEEGS